jgi:asparagine synthase (glutamine-hydrolysing)
MCGIAGLAAPGGLTAEDVTPLVATLVHRGPDAHGIWSDGLCALGHRRLAIIDVSAAGRQPLASADGAVQVVFNGEIYNYRELRDELTACGHRFRTRTDTEVIVEAYREWGTGVVSRLDGMFAFGLWDARARRLMLARDRVGKKPLYYAWHGDRFLFASELQALLADRSLPRAADPHAIDAYLSWGYVPPPRTAFQGISKLPPAHWMVVDVGPAALTSTIERYWSLRYGPKSSASFEEASAELRTELDRAVRARLMSDVPLGAFLSGGIDSSIVVGLMAQVTAKPVPTFSIGFTDARFNELPHARAVADRWKTDHHEFIVEPDALTILPDLVRHYGEPFADSSSIPTYYVSRMSRQHVTVALGGDGGDESFAGYDRYRALQMAARLQRIPGAPRAAALASRLLPDSGDPRNSLRRVKRFLNAVRLPTVERYSRWQQYFSAERKAALYSPAMRAAVGGSDADRLLARFFAADGDVVDAAMAADVDNYLPHDLMTKVDIVSMANSLEVRSPFLDHRLMEFAARLPVGFKLSGRTSKRVLKAACADLLPPGIASRGKMGFGVPIGSWFRGSLRTFLHDALRTGPALTRGVFDVAAVGALVDEHVLHGRDHAHALWNLLMLELWHREFIDRAPSPSLPA